MVIPKEKKENIDENRIKREIIEVNEKKNIINRIKTNKCLQYLCFLCFKKINNVQKVLLDEGKNIIIQHLDILNLFKKIYRDEGEQILLKEKEIKMSEFCKAKINSIINKLNNS